MTKVGSTDQEWAVKMVEKMVAVMAFWSVFHKVALKAGQLAEYLVVY